MIYNDLSAIFIENPEPFAPAIAALELSGRTLVTTVLVAFQGGVLVRLAVRAGDRYVGRSGPIDLDTIGKILLTSGQRTSKGGAEHTA